MNQDKLDAICDALKRADAKIEYKECWTAMTGSKTYAVYAKTVTGEIKKIKGWNGTDNRTSRGDTVCP